MSYKCLTCMAKKRSIMRHSEGGTCSVILAALFTLSTPLLAFNLNDPIPNEMRQQWQKVSPDVSTCFVEDEGPALCFVIEGEDHHDPVVLSLPNPHDPTVLAPFFRECEKMIEQADSEGGQKRIALFSSGQSLQGEVKEWIEKVAAQRAKSSQPAPMAIFGHPPVQIVPEKLGRQSHLVLSYGFHLPAPKTYRDVRKLLVTELIQQMTMQRLAREGVLSTHAAEGREFLLPAADLRIVLPYDEQNWQKNLQVGLEKIKEIAEIGFTNDELQAAKRDCLYLLQELQKQKRSMSGNEAHAVFQAQSFVRGLGALNYGMFLDSASSLLESITPVDIAIVMHECFSKDQRSVCYMTPHEVDTSWIAAAQQVVDLVERGENQKVAFLQQTEMEAPENLFDKLPLNDHERTLIHKIVDTMARDNVIKLGLKRKTMEKKGKRIRHVHPLRFLGYVFADPHLKHCMREISRSHFKWNGFIDGMRDRIEEEAARGGLLPYLHGFAQHVHCDEEKARRYIEKRDWEKLVKFLLE